MESDDLLLSTLADLERYVAVGDDYAMLRAAALLRQLLMDESPLAHQVNRRHRLKLRFPICGRQYADMVLAMGPVFYSALDGVHRSGPMGHQLEEVLLDQFLASKVLKLGDQVLTVGDLISISANVLGGVHKGTPKTEKEQALHDFNQIFIVSGHPVSAAQMKPLVLVVLEALAPLASAVQGFTPTSTKLRGTSTHPCGPDGSRERDRPTPVNNADTVKERTTTYETLLEGLDGLLSLACDLGIGEEAARGRFGQYRRRLIVLIEFVQRLRAGDPVENVRQEILEHVADYRIALHEVQDLNMLTPVLVSIPADIARRKLAHIVAGPALPRDENPASNQARNIQFEITLAALLQRAGYAPHIGEHPDLLVTVDDTDYAIECKRMFSAAKVGTRISEAGKQLHRDKHQVRAGTRGIVAISVARFLSGNNEIFPARDARAGYEALATYLDGIRVAAQPRYHPLFLKKYVVAILFHATASFDNLSSGRFDHGTQWTAESYVPAGARYTQSIRTLRERLIGLGEW